MFDQIHVYLGSTGIKQSTLYFVSSRFAADLICYRETYGASLDREKA